MKRPKSLQQLAAHVRRRLAPPDPLKLLRRNTLAVRDLAALKHAMNWTLDPYLDAPHLHQFQGLEDLNGRPLRDAQVIYTAARNANASTILEIGTAFGHTTAQLARHAPAATVYTVNIPPEEIAQGGKTITYALSREQIGREYRNANCHNVQQILANTATWQPDVGEIDIAFIDGCHDTEFVYNDTRKVLEHARPGALILWHDFSLTAMHNFPWIKNVCLAVEQLYAEKRLVGPIFHLADSWVGLYRVPGHAAANTRNHAAAA